MEKKCIRKDVTTGFIRCRRKDPDYFDKRSFRTKQINKNKKIITGCKKGKFKNGKCSIGVEVQSVLTKRK
jgi:hypothetical protein